jgi:two-component system OmpR family sensor kinase
VTSPRRRLGIRGRVVASFLVLLVTAEVISLVVLHQVGTRRVEDQARRDLTAAAEDLRSRLDGLAVPVGEPGAPPLADVLEEYLRDRPARDDAAYLAILDGRPFAASAGAPTALAELPQVQAWAASDETTTGSSATPAGEMEWMAVPVVAGGTTVGVLVATEFLDREQDALTDTVVVVAAVTVLVMVGACLLAWGAAGRALAPLHDLAGATRSVSDGRDLSRRMPVRSDDEVGVVAGALNGMLDRLEDAFDSQQRFLDDAGHELRTPITIVRGHLELMDDDDDPAQRAAEIALVLDELDRMDRLVRDLRVVARSGRPDFLDLDDVELPGLVEGIGRKAEALADRTWVIEPTPAAVLRADRHRLTEAVLNLVDNAVDATGPGDRIHIGATVATSEVDLWVRDHGPGIEPDDLHLLFDRGARPPSRRPGGTGLGLPIVAAIAAAHGGSVSVESTPGEGATFHVHVPLAVAVAR